MKTYEIRVDGAFVYRLTARNSEELAKRLGGVVTRSYKEYHRIELSAPRLFGRRVQSLVVVAAEEPDTIFVHV